MKWFQRKNNSLNEEEEDCPDIVMKTSMDVEFKQFRETYRTITFHMIVGQLYPNPETDGHRAIGIVVAIISLIPLTVLVLLDVFNSWQRRDIINIMRHATVIGPLLGTLLKMILFYMRRAEAYRIIKTIDNDHSSYNSLPEHHKIIARNGINESKFYSEYCWAWIVAISVLIFPLTAGILNVYSQLFESDPVLYMIHDTAKPFSKPEDRFNSPYYEFIFVYMTYCAFLLIVSFTGFDAFFGVTINHVCLKIDLLCKGLDDAMMERDSNTMFKEIVGVTKQHNHVFRLVGIVQETFNIWLGVILIATMMQICNCMYQVIEGYGVDPKYLVFTLATIVHIYMPCRYAAKLQAAAAGVAERVYCSGWERTGELRVRRMAVFMIARAQRPVNITAFNIVNFDMELFVSLLQKSYSLFTLMRP